MRESAGLSSASFDGLLLEQGFERVDLMTACEGQECLLRRGAIREVGLERALDGLRRVLSFDVAVELAAKRGIGAEAAANVDVVALDRVALFRHLHLGAEKPDVSDVMLGAGVGAPGEMDVDRTVELHSRLAPAGDLLGMALGVG